MKTGAVGWECEHGGLVDCVHVDGDHLCTACGDGKAMKIDISTGEVVWKYNHGVELTSVHVDGGYLYTGSNDGKARRMLL